MANTDFNSEEMQRYIEAQKKKLEEALARMTPEERAVDGHISGTHFDDLFTGVFHCQNT